MPIYEYVCSGCGSQIEVIQRFSDPPLESCSSCSGKLEKKISPSAFHLKGSGWYVTDYARKSGAGNGQETGDGGKKKADGETKDSGTKPDPAGKASDAPAAASKPANTGDA